MMKEFFAEELKAAEEKGMRKLKRVQLLGLAELCLMYENEEMGIGLAREADHGYWYNDVGNAGLSGHRAHPSVYDSEARYCDVVAQVAMFFNEKGLTALGAKCAREAERPDLNKHRSAIRGEKDKEELVQSKGGDSEDIAHDKTEDRGELSRVAEDDTREPVDSKEKDTGGDKQAGTVALDQPHPSRAQALSSLPIGGFLDRWQAGGFSDEDSTAACVVDVMKFYRNRLGDTLTLDDVHIIPNPAMGGSDPRPYQQASRLYQLEVGCNFWFPHPARPGHKMGKVDDSAFGLTVILQALRAVVCNYDGQIPISPRNAQTKHLVEADGAMDYVRPLENGQTYHVLAEPFKPEGVRSALAALQSAARHSTIG